MKIIKLPSVESTNKLAKEYDINTAIVSEVQTGGKGRFNRSWSSEIGGLYFSIVYACDRTPTQYTIIASLAVLDTVGMGEIKWPNDIYVEGKKLCGILSESVFSGSNCIKVIVGIGINVSNQLPNDLKEIAIRLCDISDKDYNMDKMVEDIIDKIEDLCKLSFVDVLALYKEKCLMLGKEVTIKKMDTNVVGVAIDIDSEGKLILETSNGTEVIEEGDVSII